ncbi:galactokinase [Microbacterium sp. LRZ72]|uniref:galactokinase n=1 Tax=Microbacterium sp. LRZ72 TaxID=2942481 RepID=UPI00299FC0EA|nr:galactokinase [Microbacterium sp. LRZ72]MDX2376486.1 galactokinase [Microbacterium sp. LRZ72]
MTARDAAVAAFTHLTDDAPGGVWSAPGRANLIGEHTDYNDGFVLPVAIGQRTYAALGRRTDRIVRVASTFADDAVDVRLDEVPALFDSPADRQRVPEWARYPLGVAWAALRVAGADPRELCGLDIVFASDVPVGAGLSSSAAIEGAAASALNDAWGLGLSPLDLARIGRAAENEAVGAPTGIMDQVASIMGRADAAIFLDCRTLETASVDLGFAAAGLELLVIDTRVQHSHANGGYRERRASCEAGAAGMGVGALRDLSVDDLPRAERVLDDVTLRRVRHIVTENQRVLDTVRALRERGPRAIGELLVASHASMRDDFEISVPELDAAVESALAAGAIGARMTGGGFGGAAIALVPADLARQVTDAVGLAFEDRGFIAPLVFPLVPSAGARREA